MRRFLLTLGAVAGLAAVTSAYAADGGAGPACIQSNAVRGLEVADNRTILFHTSGGDVLVNHLTEPCAGVPGPNGFYYGFRADSYICANKDVVRIRERSVCHLGAFSEYGHDKGRDLRDPAGR